MKRTLIFLLLLVCAIFAVGCTTLGVDSPKINSDYSLNASMGTSNTHLYSGEEQVALESSVLESESVEESSGKGVFDDEYWSERR